jgi:DNA polymerase III gamma/tau subunit
MNSMPNPDQADPHDVAVAALKQAREEIGRADRQLPRVDEQVSRLGPGAARKPSGQQKRLAVPDRRSSRGRLALLGLIGLLLAACICVAALAWPYGDAAKLTIARWAPQRVSTSSLPLEKQELPAQPSPAPVDVAATAALPQPAPLAQTTPQDTAPTAAPPELAQWLQTMARDLANVEQGIEQLKTSQEQMVRDNANLAEQLKAAQAQMARDNENAAAQLKASQEQIARLIAKASEQNLRPRTSAPPPRPIATPTRKPVPKLSSPQARARPLAPPPEPKPPEQE